MAEYEVRVILKPDLSLEHKKFIENEIIKLAEKYGMERYEDGITYGKKPPYKRFEDVPEGAAFIVSLNKYRDCFSLLEYYSYLEGVKGDLNGNVMPLKKMIYLLTINTYDSTCIHGAYTDKRILLKDYAMLLEKDRRFTQKNSLYNIRIYLLEPNVFYGEYTDWLYEKDNQFYEKLESVDIEELRIPVDGFLEAAKVFVEENKEQIEIERIEYLNRKE